MNLDCPIIILGAPRSGTTFLGDVLACHSSVRYFVEPNPVWRWGNEGYSDALKREYATPKVVDRIRRYFEDSVTADGKARILEKTPQNCLRASFVDAVFPNARYIHIIRNGYESALSIRANWLRKGKGLEGVRVGQRLREIRGTQYLKYGWQFAKRCVFAWRREPVVMWGPRIPGLEQMRKELSLLEVSAYQWKQCTEMARMAGRDLGVDRYQEYCLETLNRERIEEICDFLDLGMEARMMEFFDEQFSQSATAYRTKGATSAELREVAPIIDPTMEWLALTHPIYAREHGVG